MLKKSRSLAVEFNFRKKLFWCLDLLKGGDIYKNYKEIKFVNENFNSQKSQSIRNQALNNILKHASTTTPFYKSLKENFSIEKFSVIDKSIIKANFQNLYSEAYKNKKNYKVSSSGSTGTPLELFQGKIKRNRNIADTIFFAEKAGFKFGTKLYFMRVWTKYNRKSLFLSWAQNVVMQDVKKLSDDSISEIVTKLYRDKSEKGILSYASSLESICKYLDKINSKQIDCNLNSVIANSESLSQYTKEAIKKYFNINAISRYSNAENGLLAQQAIDSGNEFNINWGSYYIEVLKFEEDTPAEYGEIGRIVITDLFNYCMPIIRYDTGDIGSIVLNKNKVPVFNTIEGRMQDMVFNTNGQLISSFVIGGLMKKYSSLKQYQFVQTHQKTYTIKLNTDKEFNEKSKIIEEFKNIIGNDSNIALEFLDEIPTLASGKRRQVVNNFNNNI